VWSGTELSNSTVWCLYSFTMCTLLFSGKIKVIFNKRDFIVGILFPFTYKNATKKCSKRFFHSNRSFVSFSIVLQHWWCCIYFSTVLCHVVFGVPLFRFPSGVQCTAVRGSIFPYSNSCPIPLQHRCFRIVLISPSAVGCRRSLFEMVRFRARNSLSTAAPCPQARP